MAPMSEVESTEVAAPEARPVPGFRSPRDLCLFFEALALQGLAQRISREPVDAVARALGRAWVPLRTSTPGRAAAAARRAGVRGARWAGWLDTCLTRSLVAAALLDGSRRVVLHVGFRPGEDGTDGHAWLSVDGRRLELSTPPGSQLPWEETLTLTIRNGGSSP